MPHQRRRYIELLLSARIRANPLVIINGPRQCGKSFLARDLLRHHFKKLAYFTLDNQRQLHLALENPASFLSKIDSKELLIIDEEQKAPNIFDAIKEIVDLSRIPGQFLLLGSTEFSHRTRVKESLTGRAISLRLFPFTIGEIKHLDLPKSTLISATPRVGRRDVLDYLERGGMPAIFSVRDQESRLAQHEDWVATTIERNLKQVSGRSLIDVKLANDLLRQIARSEESSDTSLARSLRTALPRIQQYLSWFKALFVINEITPCFESSGRSQHFLCDVGIADSLGAPFSVKLKTWVALEILSRNWAKGVARRNQLETYRSPKGGRIDFIYTDAKQKRTAILIIAHEQFAQQDTEIIRSFGERLPDTKCIILAPVNKCSVEGKVECYPWECLG